MTETHASADPIVPLPDKIRALRIVVPADHQSLLPRAFVTLFIALLNCILDYLADLAARADRAAAPAQPKGTLNIRAVRPGATRAMPRAAARCAARNARAPVGRAAPGETQARRQTRNPAVGHPPTPAHGNTPPASPDQIARRKPPPARRSRFCRPVAIASLRPNRYDSETKTTAIAGTASPDPHRRATKSSSQWIV